MIAPPRSNRALVLGLVAIVAGMGGMAYAAVPLYKLFCQVTGFAGTPLRADAATGTVVDRTVTVILDATVNDALPWRFRAEERRVTLRIGEERLAFYRAENRSDRAVIGTATFNVSPAKAAPYFNKIQCFCFTEQRLEAGETVEMPVSFFVDPAILDDPGTRDLREITLSYTFFRAVGDSAAAATRPGADSAGAVAAPAGRVN